MNNNSDCQTVITGSVILSAVKDLKISVDRYFALLSMTHSWKTVTRKS